MDRSRASRHSVRLAARRARRPIPDEAERDDRATTVPLARDGNRSMPSATTPTAVALKRGILRSVQQEQGNTIAQRLIGVWRLPVIESAEDQPKLVEPAILTAFAADFADAAAMIRTSAEACKLVKEAQAAGTKYGGFSEDGPGKVSIGAWPYTTNGTVYIPKAHLGDKIIAMSDFLFEINNAIREPKFAKIHAEAAKGSKGSLTAKTYAYQKTEQEVEGMLRLGQVWFEVKKQAKGTEWDKYDGDFYLSEYKAFTQGKKTKDDIIKDVLGRTYSSGALAGKTVEQFYSEQFEQVSGGK